MKPAQASDGSAHGGVKVAPSRAAGIVGHGANAPDPATAPWWRHRWPWLLMLGPALAIVGCAVTIILALHYYGDQEIHDGGKREGLVVSPPAHRAG